MMDVVLYVLPDDQPETSTYVEGNHDTMTFAFDQPGVVWLRHASDAPWPTQETDRNLYPTNSEADVFDTALASLESQNQALQEEVERLKAREMPTLQRKGVATASGTTSDNAALQERLDRQEVYISKEIPALQERAGQAEARIRAAYQVLGFYDGDEIPPRIRERFLTALSPTQETDEPDCTRCGNERTVGGYGTDERLPCPVCRPTQETDPG